MIDNNKDFDFFNVYTGEIEDGFLYGKDSSVFKRTDNIKLVRDSRGKYLGIKTCRGSFNPNGIYTARKGPSDFKSYEELKIWVGQKCIGSDNPYIRMSME